MPSALCRFCPCPCPCPGRWPRGFGGRRPRRLLLRPPPPEGLPGPAFIVLSKFFCLTSIRINSCRIQIAPGRILMSASAKTAEGCCRELPGDLASLANKDAQLPGAHPGTISHSRKPLSLCKPIDLFAYRFSDFGSVAPPREGLAWKACAGTRPNENILILLAPAAPRKGHRHGLLHRRTWLLEPLSPPVVRKWRKIFDRRFRP